MRWLASASASGSKRAVCPVGGRPTITAAPPSASAPIAGLGGRDLPDRVEDVVEVARARAASARRSRSRPTRFATSSLAGLRSQATIRAACASRAPWITDSPTPPQPITPTVASGGTPAVLRTAPRPVATAQPTIATTSSGTSLRIFTAPERGTTTRSANAETPR